MILNNYNIEEDYIYFFCTLCTIPVHFLKKENGFYIHECQLCKEHYKLNKEFPYLRFKEV